MSVYIVLTEHNEFLGLFYRLDEAEQLAAAYRDRGAWAYAAVVHETADALLKKHERFQKISKVVDEVFGGEA